MPSLLVRPPIPERRPNIYCYGGNGFSEARSYRPLERAAAAGLGAFLRRKEGEGDEECEHALRLNDGCYPFLLFLVARLCMCPFYFIFDASLLKRPAPASPFPWQVPWGVSQNDLEAVEDILSATSLGESISRTTRNLRGHVLSR